MTESLSFIHRTAVPEFLSFWEGDRTRTACTEVASTNIRPTFAPQATSENT